jgi:hypothetical protein
MITRFLGQTLPPEFLIRSNGEIEVIREGESFFADEDGDNRDGCDLAVAAAHVRA